MLQITQSPRARVAAGYQNNPKSRNYAKTVKSQRRVPNLNLDSDQEARKAWRQNKQPDDHYDLPSGYDPNVHVGSFESFKFVEATTGTHISLRKRKGHADNNIYVAEIWGDRKQCQQAKDAIFDYISNSDARGHRAFAKVENNRGGQVDAKIHEQLKRDQRRLKFCRLPESELVNKRYAYSIVVPWKEQEHSWRIEEMLGHQLEALDEIRMDSRCYIHLSRQGREANFVLLGDNYDRMMEAASRIQEIPSRLISYALPPTQLYLLKPLSTPFDYSAFMVKLIDYYHRYSASAEKAGRFLKLEPSGIHEGQYLSEEVAAVTSLDEIDEQGAVWLGSEHSATLNAQYLNLWVTRALSQLTVYRGYVHMELNIGTCIYMKHKTQSKLDIATLEDVLLDLNSGIVELGSFMAADLGDYQGGRLLERFISNRTQFSFYDSVVCSHWSLQQCLDACQPRLKAAFVIEQGPTDNLRLELEFKKDGLSEYYETSRRWLKLGDDGTAPGNFLSINILDLERPHTSYELKIDRYDVLNELRETRLRPVYHQFANKVKPETAKEPLHSTNINNKRLFTIPATGTGSQVKLRSCEQSRSWLFSIKDCGYFVEVYATSSIDIKPEAKNAPHTTYDPRPGKEYWGMRIWHEEWAKLFSQNKELGVARKTRWQPTEAQFFPSEGHVGFESMEGTEAEVGAGFNALLRAAKAVEDVAMSGQVEEKKAMHAPPSSVADTDALTDRNSDLIDTSIDPVTSPICCKPTVLAQGSEKPISSPGTEILANFDSMLRITPNMKKKRLNTTSAKRSAIIASLEQPKSSADVRIAAYKCFASADAKLHAQSSQSRKSSAKPITSRRRGKNKAGAQSIQPTPLTERNFEVSNGSKVENSGPEDRRPKLPTPSGTRSMQATGKSWASVAAEQKTGAVVGGKQKGGDIDEFPIWQTVKK